MAPKLVLFLAAAIQLATCDVVNISGGDTTPIVNHPFQVSISVGNEFVCSGALIKENWVVTVASCVSGYGADYMVVRAGSKVTKQSNTDGQEVGVRQVVAHEKFTDRNMDYDIALLELQTPFTMGQKVKLIRIAHDPLKEGQKVTVSGWGEAENETFGVYNKLDMEVTPLEKCKEMLMNEIVTNNMVCAWAGLGKGPCWGDFGDPLVNEWKALVGLYSFSKDCLSYPSVFTNVVTLSPWIKSNMKPAPKSQE